MINLFEIKDNVTVITGGTVAVVDGGFNAFAL